MQDFICQLYCLHVEVPICFGPFSRILLVLIWRCNFATCIHTKCWVTWRQVLSKAFCTWDIARWGLMCSLILVSSITDRRSTIIYCASVGGKTCNKLKWEATCSGKVKCKSWVSPSPRRTRERDNPIPGSNYFVWYVHTHTHTNLMGTFECALLLLNTCNSVIWIFFFSCTHTHVFRMRIDHLGHHVLFMLLHCFLYTFSFSLLPSYLTSIFKPSYCQILTCFYLNFSGIYELHNNQLYGICILG